MSAHSFTRKELYELVWSEPMSKLCKTLGISDRGLAKACARVNIPVPPRGYWARRDAGQKVEADPLPQLKNGERDQVVIDPPKVFERPKPPAPPLSAQALEQAELAREKQITVPDTLHKPHPILTEWIKTNQKEIAEERRRGWGTRTPSLQLEGLPERRLRILDTLLKALEERGYRLKAHHYRSGWIEIHLKDAHLVLLLDEYLRQQRRALTKEERANSWNANQSWTQEKVATGTLRLCLQEQMSHGTRGRWHETAEQPMETRLNEVLGTVAGDFERMRLYRIAAAEATQRRHEEEQRQYLAKQERKREQIRVNRLIRAAQNRRTAADIRDLVAAVAAKEEAGEAQTTWSRWALEQADALDPLKSEDLFDLSVDDYELYSLR